MAVTVQQFNNAIKHIGEGIVDMSLDTFKVALLNGYTFDASDDEFSDVSGLEITAAGGYTPTGITIDNSTWTAGSGATRLDGDDATFTASGNVDPFTHAVLYSATSGKLMVCYAFGETVNLTASDQLLLLVHSDGLLKFNFVGV